MVINLSFYSGAGEIGGNKIQLEAIYLAPNNPRFLDTKWVDIPDEGITKADIQEGTRRRLIEKFGLDKLRMNME